MARSLVAQVVGGVTQMMNVIMVVLLVLVLLFMTELLYHLPQASNKATYALYYDGPQTLEVNVCISNPLIENSIFFL